MRYLFGISILFCVALTSIGCSNSNPSIPNDNPVKSINTTNLPVWISERFPDGSPSGGAGLLGLFTVSIDSIDLKSELTPFRNSNLTDVLEAIDITNFLSLAPCTDCVKIMGLELDIDGNLVLKIGIRHPFDVGEPLKPISGRNRADLHVFNVEGIVLAEADNPVQFNGIGATVADITLLSADGYTGHLDESIDDIFPTAATIHPYVLHFDDYSQGNFDPLNPMGFASVTEPPPSGNLVMAMGCGYNIQDYVFKTPLPSFSFTFAVGCTYGIAARTKSDRFNPEYRVPQHLKKAASEVRVEVTRNELIEGTISSEADIEISVVDPSHGIEVGSALNQMFAASDVSSIRIDIPSILVSTKDVPLTPISGTGHDPTDPLIYSVTITNEANALEGTYHGLVEVTDSYPTGANESPLLDGRDGISRVDPLVNPLDALFDIPEFATYQVFSIDVAFRNEPPQVGAVTGCAKVIAGHPFTFHVVATDPNTGQTLTYYWDNGEHTPGVYDDATTTIGDADLTFAAPGNYTVDVQVDDGAGGVATSSDPLEVVVLPDGVFVDADNIDDPSMDGSWDHPWAWIQNGINNATASGYVYVFPSTDPYDTFLISTSPRNVYGFDPDCGLDRPVINVTAGNTYMDSSSNSSIENFIFAIDYTINYSSVELIVLSNSNNIAIRNCRFTGESDAKFTFILRPINVDNSTVENCEWVEILLNGPPTDFRYAYMINGLDCSTFTVIHNEFHDLGIPDLGSETNWTGIWAVRFGINSDVSSNISVKNNLFYNFWDHSPAILPPGDKCNVLHAMEINNTSGYLIDHNTIDDFDCNNGDSTKNAWSVGLYGAMSDGTVNNNVFKSLNYLNGSIGHNSAGFWADSSTAVAANYCCVFWGDPPPPGGAQVASYLNMIYQGIGSYNQNQLVDPDFDYATEANYYHPQNTLVKNGDETGGEMGAFGGPDGDWTPPSQIY